MSSDILATLNAKLSSLNAQKATIDAEISEIEGAIKVIGKYSLRTDVKPGYTPLSLLRPMPKQQQIIDGAASILSDGKPRHTHELLVELTERGIAVGGNDPKGNLSAYLSREKELFENDRRLGWSLKKQTPEGVAAPTGAEDLL